MLWNMFQSYVVEIGVIVTIVGFLLEARRRFNNALKADNERHRKEILKILNVVVEQQKTDSERLKRVEERQIRGEEQIKGIGGIISALQQDIRAIWQPAVGSFFGKKTDQGSDNHPNDSSPS